MNRIDVPAHSILAVTTTELKEEFDLINSDGAKVSPWATEAFALAYRHRDRRVFRPARFHPSDTFVKDMIYLEEL